MEEKILTANEALALTKKSYFLDKVIYKWIENAAKHNHNCLHLNGDDYDTEKLMGVLDKVKEKGYSITHNAKINEYTISWKEV